MLGNERRESLFYCHSLREIPCTNSLTNSYLNKHNPTKITNTVFVVMSIYSTFNILIWITKRIIKYIIKK